MYIRVRVPTMIALIQNKTKRFYLGAAVITVLVLLGTVLWRVSHSVQHTSTFTDHSSCGPHSPPSSKQTLLTVPEHLLAYHSRVFQTNVDLETEQFTIVMLTYKRDATLPTVLTHYCDTPHLAKIVVIWNDVEREIPSDILKLTESCCVPLVFIKETENKITNRFKPRPEIQTDCVFILDDDRWLDDLTDVQFAFNVWQENRQRIVGFDDCQRSHSRDSDGKYTYDQPVPGGGVSIMMTATGFLHRAYLDMYFDPKVLPADMFDKDDWTMYCDDILMNCVVSKFLEEVSWPQPNLISIKQKGSLDNIEREAGAGGGHQGLHKSRPDHYERRSECLNKLADLYGGTLPLRTTRVSVQENIISGVSHTLVYCVLLCVVLAQSVLALCLGRCVWTNKSKW